MHLDNPQSINRYSYSINDPINLNDATGLDCAYLSDGGDSIDSVDRNSTAEECGSTGGYWVDGAVIGGFFFSDSNQVILYGQDPNGNYNLSNTNYDVKSTSDLIDNLDFASLQDTLTGLIGPDKSNVNILNPTFGAAFKMWLTPSAQDCKNQVTNGDDRYENAKLFTALSGGTFLTGIGSATSPFLAAMGAVETGIGFIDKHILAPACNDLRNFMTH